MTAAEETRALWQRATFRWGSTDCVLSVCDHVRRATGIDPAAPWRGTYDDEAGARAVWAPHGDLLGLFRHGMAQAGFREGEPAHGAPVIAQVGPEQVAGIIFGTRIGFLSHRGLIETRAPILGAWIL